MMQRLRSLLQAFTYKKMYGSEDKEVEIPVEGIKDGVVYEREVKPMGNEPIYTEVRIDGKDDDRKEETAKSADSKVH